MSKYILIILIPPYRNDAWWHRSDSRHTVHLSGAPHERHALSLIHFLLRTKRLGTARVHQVFTQIAHCLLAMWHVVHCHHSPKSMNKDSLPNRRHRNFCRQQSCMSQPDWKLSYKRTRTQAYSGDIRWRAANKRKTNRIIRRHEDIWSMIWSPLKQEREVKHKTADHSEFDDWRRSLSKSSHPKTTTKQALPVQTN